MPTDKTLKMEREIGGFCCCGQTPYRANVSFDKDQYSPGEIANVTVDLDNSQCAKDVVDFKLRLYQYVDIWADTSKRGATRPSKQETKIEGKVFKDIECKKGDKCNSSF